MFSAPGFLILLRAATGTDTGSGATTVDSVAVSGLTALDTLVVQACFSAAVQNTALPSVYNVTDSVTILKVAQNVATAPTGNLVRWVLRQSPALGTKVFSESICFDSANAGVLLAGVATFTTAWTGAWTLGLRHDGMTAGGTLTWAWSVYKMRGQ